MLSIILAAVDKSAEKKNLPPCGCPPLYRGRWLHYNTVHICFIRSGCPRLFGSEYEDAWSSLPPVFYLSF